VIVERRKRQNEIIPRNKRLQEFYDKKREEGKPFKVAVIACANKLLHWIYALLKSAFYLQYPTYFKSITKQSETFQTQNLRSLFGIHKFSIA
jgi:hypothetical protein